MIFPGFGGSIVGINNEWTLIDASQTIAIIKNPTDYLKRHRSSIRIQITLDRNAIYDDRVIWRKNTLLIKTSVPFD